MFSFEQDYFSSKVLASNIAIVSSRYTLNQIMQYNALLWTFYYRHEYRRNGLSEFDNWTS